MKAVIFEKFGSPDVLQITAMPEPIAGPDEILVKVCAATVNPTDIMMRNGAQAGLMQDLDPPFIAGMEFSGVVHDPGQSEFRLGEPVMGVINPRTPKGGAYAQIIAVPAASVASLPPEVDLIGAATVPMNALTASMSLDFLDLSPGNSLLVTGGAGMLGGAAIQLGRAAGLKVYANVADKDRDLVIALGADVILPRDQGLDATLDALCPEGLDGVIDGALIGQTLAHIVREGGAMVSLRGNYKIEDPRLRIHNVSVIAGLRDTLKLKNIAKLLAASQLTARVAENGIFTFNEAAEAHHAAENNRARGRIVLVFNDL